jgi:hypothetical protein
MAQSGLEEGDGSPSSRPAAKACVCGDECGTNTSLSPMYAYAPKGRRAYYAQVPRNRGANTTLLLASSMSLEGMGPCLAVEGTTTTS